MYEYASGKGETLKDGTRRWVLGLMSELMSLKNRHTNIRVIKKEVNSINY